MSKTDKLVMGYMLAALIVISNYSLLLGSITGTVLFLINCVDTKKETRKNA